MTLQEHKDRHKFLHKALDELAADYLIHQRDKGLSDTSVLDLIEWSSEQTRDPMWPPGIAPDEETPK
ncbi:MAG TPA: hypothetical protein VK797_23425 [Tepidisphaeraceae bacterium]|jgi:hypothetical protein|nr:hypothetical protein [Tepidisphaeraceae bacterium]